MNILTEIDRQLYLLEKEYEEVVKRLKREKHIPDYTMRVTSGHGHNDYYYRDENGGLVYIPVANREFAREMIQKDYDNRVLIKLSEQKRLLENIKKRYVENPVDVVYEKCCKGRQVLISPLIPTKEEYIKQWFEATPGSQNTFETQGTYLTNRGEYVRSKSEKILADMFYQFNIPYQYEPRVELIKGRVCYPDFALLNVRERRTIYWEHFGLASDKQYSDKNLDKICRYEQSGIIIGDNLLLSIESAGIQLDIKMIETKIKKYLC